MKQLKSFLLLGLFGMVSMGASAYDFSEKNSIGKTIYYNIISSTTVSVTYKGNTYDSEQSYVGFVEIPNTVTYYNNTYSVAQIEEGAFYNCSRLTSLTIPNSVTKIDSHAFYGCENVESISWNSNVSPHCITKYCSENLKSVSIGNSVTSIGDNAFYGCSGLTSVTIPNSVTSIGDYAFSRCSGLTSVYVKWQDADKIPDVDEYCFPYSTCDLYVPDGTIKLYQKKRYWNYFRNIPKPDNEIWYTANSKLNETTNLYTFGIHTNAFNTTIQSHTFSNGVGIITFNADVTSIGDYAFYNCSGLTSVTIPNSVTSIGDYAFYYCSGLKNVTIGNSVTSIGKFAFSNCSGLTSVTIPNSVTSIGDDAFNRCSGLTSVTIGNSVTSIGDRAFRDCSGLTSVTIPNSVTEIGAQAFFCCFGLTSVTIGNSVTSIGDYAFRECSGLTSIKVESGNTVYDSRDNCNAIIETKSNELISGCKNTIIPNSVTSIGNYAFYNCSGLTSVTIPNSVTSIGDAAFYACSGLTSVTIGNSVTSIGFWAFYDCSGLTSMVVEIGNTFYDSRDNCNAIIETKSNTLISGCKNTIIPNSVTTIGNYAFHNCSGLTSVTIPNSVISIGDWAFYNCSGLTRVNITDLDKWAEIEFGIDYSNPLYYSHNLYLNGQLVTKANLTTAKKIGSYAFYGYDKLTSVTIGISVTSIGKEAFYECSGLTKVNITDLDKWAEIEFGNYNANPLYYAHNLYLNEQLVTEAKLTTATKIGSYAFYSYDKLTSVTIPNSVTTIGNYAFSGCSSLPVVDNIRYADTYLVKAVDKTLTTYNIKVGTKWIGSEAFYGCSGLTSVTIPNSVTSIGDDAFNRCSGLTSVTIGNSVTSIGEEAFQNCSDLKNVYVGWKYAKEIPSINGATFSHYSNLYVPYGTKSMYEGNSSWKLFVRIIEPSEQIVKISAAKYGTFGSRYAAKIPDGVSAYTANVDGSTVTMTKIKTGVIPGDCGVILYAESGDYRFAPNAEVDQIEGNQLVSVTDRTYTCTGEDVGKVYYLGLDNESKATFVRLNENGTIPVGKAYLKLDAALDAGAKLDVVFGDEPTGIEEVQGSRFKVQGSVYNLNGVRVNKDYKGIIIVNGKKYMNK